MTTAILTLRITSDWHCGSGRGGGPDLDAEVVKTRAGLPFVPGRTLKGLLRDAVTLAASAGVYDEGFDVDALFGSALPRGSAPAALPAEDDAEVAMQERRFTTSPGRLRVDSARLGATRAEAAAWERWAEKHPVERSMLFREFASTAIDDATGAAKDGTLRAVEIVVPMTLHAELQADGEDWVTWIEHALPFVDGVGSGRTRGFGAWTGSIAVVPDPVKQEAARAGPPAAGALGVRYRLETDVALSREPANAAGHETLEHLPGSAILGAVARALYRHDEEWTRTHDWTLFFSGKVRFSNGTLGGRQPVPLSLHQAKSETSHPIANRARLGAPETARQQIRRQWTDAAGSLAKARVRASMRTAIDTTAGRARDGHLYDLEALESGQEFIGTIEVDADTPNRAEVLTRIEAALVEPLRLGRSSGQELGLVSAQVSPLPGPEVALDHSPAESGHLLVWLLSDVALVDDAGLPTWVPQARHFGLDGRWVPERSFVATRSYSPFRNRRSAPRSDYARRPGEERKVLQAGSVLVFETSTSLQEARERTSTGIGLFRAEGLGRVAVEPTLLAGPTWTGARSAPNGADRDAARAAEAWLVHAVGAASTTSVALARWIDARAAETATTEEAWLLAHRWLEQLRLKRRLPPSQWGELRERVRQAKAGEVSEAVRMLVAPPEPQPATHAVYGEGKTPARGGMKVGASTWSRLGLAGWLTKALETASSVPEPTLRQALLLLTEEAVRVQRRRD